MRETLKSVLKIEKTALGFVCVITLCSVCLAVTLSLYFNAYKNPFMMQDVANLSEGWTYSTDDNPSSSIETLRTGPFLNAGDTMTINRILTEYIDNAAVLIRANHQFVFFSVSAQL